MAERYTRLFALTENLYQSGSPVLIAAGALLKDTQTGRVLAQIKLQSLSDQPIKAAKVNITPIDVTGAALGGALEHQYLDLNIRRDEAFGTKSPVYLPDATARGFTAEVRSVVFADNTVWTASDTAWEPLPAPVPLEKDYPDTELRKQFQLEFGSGSQYAYAEFADLCRCPCGALNRQNEAKCHVCGCDLSALRKLDSADLESRKNERLEQERIANEKAAKDAAEQAKKAKKIALIVAPIVCVVIAFLIVLSSVIIPNSRYNKAVALMDAGQYREALEAFEAMDGYKDSAEKLDECAVAILDAAYDTAVAWMELGDYETAIEGFEILGEYRDSTEKLVECELATQYDAAVELMESGEYREAYDVFDALDDYKDSTDMLKECRNAMSESPKVGDYIFFGEYEQDNVSSNGKEEILWIVLDIQAEQLFLISKYALDGLPYDEEGGSVTWEDCTLRNWLNSEFLNSAFSAEEQVRIPLVTVSADRNPSFDTDPGSDTRDKVFLLSIPEAKKYFASDNNRQCQPTDYAVSQGTPIASDVYFCWWLRSPGNFQFSASYVNNSGVVNPVGDPVHTSYVAVRPAIWVDLNG